MAIKFFKFFRAGTHITQAGEKISFSEIDLSATAKFYPLATKKAPLVLGHPANDGPAMGTVISLVAKGDSLFAEADVSDELVNHVRARRYIERSAAFFRKDDPRNPTGGIWGLRHIGFLGQQPPAVKGMGALNFAEPSMDLMYACAGVMSPMVDMYGASAQVCFAETIQGGPAYQQAREAMHKAINGLIAKYPEFCYIEAARMLESMFLAKTN